jgi:hypothetical protein
MAKVLFLPDKEEGFQKKRFFIENGLEKVDYANYLI